MFLFLLWGKFLVLTLATSTFKFREFWFIIRRVPISIAMFSYTYPAFWIPQLWFLHWFYFICLWFCMYLLKSLACMILSVPLYIPFYNFMTLFQEDFLEERRIKRMYWIHQYEQEPKFMWQENVFWGILIVFFLFIFYCLSFPIFWESSH